MFQRPPSVSRNFVSAPGPLGELEPAEPLVAHVGRRAADHVADVQLGHLVVGEVERLVAARAAARGASVAASCRESTPTPTKMCASLAAVQPVVELGDDAPAERDAELADRRRAARGWSPRTAPRAPRRARRARRRSAADRSSCWRRSGPRPAARRGSPLRGDPALQPGHRQRARRLHHACACRRRCP